MYVGKNYPDTSVEEPLMLFNKNNNNVSMPPEPEVPKFPVFSNMVSVETDASQAKVRYFNYIMFLLHHYFPIYH